MGSGVSKQPNRNQHAQSSSSENGETQSEVTATQKKINKIATLKARVEPIGDSAESGSDKEERSVAAVESSSTTQEAELLRLKDLVTRLEAENASLLKRSQLPNIRREPLPALNGENGERLERFGLVPLSQEQLRADLHRDLTDARNQIKKLRVQQKKKLHLLNTQLTECKQEHSLKCIEYNGVIEKLSEENATLLERIEELSRAQTKSGQGEGDQTGRLSAKPISDSRMTLVLELSAKVSEQEAEIARLNETIREQQKQMRMADISDSGTANVQNGWKSGNTSFARPSTLSSGGQWRSAHESNNDESANFRDSGCDASDDSTAVSKAMGNGTSSFQRELSDCSSGVDDQELNNDINSTPLADLSPANLRQVSAPFDRRRSKLIDDGKRSDDAVHFVTTTGKPPSGKPTVLS